MRQALWDYVPIQGSISDFRIVCGMGHLYRWIILIFSMKKQLVLKGKCRIGRDSWIFGGMGGFHRKEEKELASAYAMEKLNSLASNLKQPR